MKSTGRASKPEACRTVTISKRSMDAYNLLEGVSGGEGL